MSAGWLPVIVAALSILGAAATYAYQKQVDRRSSLLELRRAAYRQYLAAFVDMTNTPERNPEITRAMLKSEFDLLVVGSDEVVTKVGQLSRFYLNTNEDRFNRDVERTKTLVADVCTAMRADCFQKTRLSNVDMRNIIPMA